MTGASAPVVAVVGSANLDIVLETVRFPNAGETVLGASLSDAPGGKGGNQAVAAARLVTTFLIASVGRDREGDALIAHAQSHDVQTNHVARSDIGSGRAFIQVAEDGENRIVVMPLANFDWEAGVVADHLTACQADVVLTQLEIPFDVVVDAAEWASRNGARFVLNPSPIAPLPRWLLAQADPLIMNAGEARKIVIQALESTDGLASLDDDPRELSRLLGSLCKSAIVTAGAGGVFVCENEQVTTIPARAVIARDTTGAGDEFAGTLAAELALGTDMREAARLANEAAANLVQVPRRDRL